MQTSKFTKLPKVTAEKSKRMASLSEQQLDEIREITYRAISNYRGQVDKLEAAIGALNLGHHVGWKVLYIIHNKRTIRQFEEILGITFKDYFPDTGPGSDRSFAYETAEKLKKYWKVVNGTFKVEGKREISE